MGRNGDERTDLNVRKGHDTVEIVCDGDGGGGAGVEAGEGFTVEV